MSTRKNFLTACFAAVLATGLAACGGGGDQPDEPPPPMTYNVALPDGHGLSVGMTTLTMGETMIGGTTISCPAADGCTLTVSQDPVTGLYSGVATGGMVTVAVAPPPTPPMEYTVMLPDGHGLSAGTTNLPMGDTVVGDTTISCPAADGCTLTVSMNPVTGAYMGVATGGMVTVAVADPPSPPMEYDVALPEGHDLADGTTTIDPGDTLMLPGGTEVSCPGPDQCTLTVSTDVVTGTRSGVSTGGMVTVTTEATRMAAAEEQRKENLKSAEEVVGRAQRALDAILADPDNFTANELKAAREALRTAELERDKYLPPDPEPVVVAASGSVTHAELQDGFKDILANPGDSDSFTIPAGETAVRGGITFRCDSLRPCTVTVENSLGTIVASWMSHSVDGSSVMVAASHPSDDLLNDPLHPNLTLNMANAVSVADIIEAAIGADAAPPAPEGARDNSNTAIGGMDLDGFGVDDMSGFTLTSDLDPNQSDYDSTGPSGGSKLEVPRDLRMQHADRTALMGWDHSKVLFADWGDTVTESGDGGFETAALVYSNHEGPTSEDFDGDLAGKLAHRGSWFDFTVNFGTGAATTDADDPNNAVNIADAGEDDAATQVMRSLVSPTGQSFDARSTAVSANDVIVGTYFGASGQFKCFGTDATNCRISRDSGGSTPFNLADGSWLFMPDADQTVMIPDQDYMVFGAWLTVPDDAANGEHRIGVFYDGMWEYAVGDINRLTGSATYEGGATGVYRDRDNSGMFTASATLMADFGADTASGTLSGRIEDFKNSNGVFLGTDTAADPNDPVTGGENDWVVTLVGATDNISTTDGTATVGTVSGSADGVSWDGGAWAAQLYGATGTADDPIAPSGVAGQFRAFSGAVAADGEDPAIPPTRAVVGAFGAMHQPPGGRQLTRGVVDSPRT